MSPLTKITDHLCACVICAGVVVIDDQPEVSIDDPSFLFESNEGFQEVTSRRAQKSKQKAALEEAMKKSQEAQAQAAAQAKRMEKEAKVPERCWKLGIFDGIPMDVESWGL